MIVKNIHDCKDELREVDLRATQARLTVMHFLEKTSKPIDINMIINYLNRQDLNTNPATVFRMMNTLTQKGITIPIHFQEGKTRYELSSKEDHHHLICENCGRVEDVSDTIIPIFEKEIRNKSRFRIKRHSLEFFGACYQCQL